MHFQPRRRFCLGKRIMRRSTRAWHGIPAKRSIMLVVLVLTCAAWLLGAQTNHASRLQQPRSFTRKAKTASAAQRPPPIASCKPRPRLCHLLAREERPPLNGKLPGRPGLQRGYTHALPHIDRLRTHQFEIIALIL